MLNRLAGSAQRLLHEQSSLVRPGRKVGAFFEDTMTYAIAALLALLLALLAFGFWQVDENDKLRQRNAELELENRGLRESLAEEEYAQQCRSWGG